MSKVELPSQNDSCNAEAVGTDKETCNSEDNSLWFFEYLPAELVQTIFSYFSHYELCRNIAPVCRRWRDFAYDPIHWQKVVLEYFKFKGIVQPDNLRKLFDRTGLLKYLVLYGRGFPINSVGLFDSGMPHLRELHLRYFESIDTDCLEYVRQKAPGLEHLNIEACPTMNSSCIEQICHFDKLKALNISRCRVITADDLIQLAKEIKCLNLLNIEEIKCISESCIESIVEMQFQHLQHLYLDGEGVSDLRCLSRCSDLQTLSIYCAAGLDDSFLASILKLQNLEVLIVGGRKNFTSSALRRFFENTTAKKLTRLDLPNCCLDDSAVAAFCSRYGRFLNRLDLSCCLEITDVGVEAIVGNCRVLRYLSLWGLNHINGQCFRKIPDLMPCLTFLNLAMCKIDRGVLPELVCRKANITVMVDEGSPYKCNVM